MYFKTWTNMKEDMTEIRVRVPKAHGKEQKGKGQQKERAGRQNGKARRSERSGSGARTAHGPSSEVRRARGGAS